MQKALTLIFFQLIIPLSVLAQNLDQNLDQKQAGMPWPKDEWPTKNLEQAGFSKQRFNQFLSTVFFPHLTFSTDTVVVIKDGFLVHEEYAHGFSRNRKHALFSLGKTVIAALVGVMELEGLIHRNETVNRYYPKLDPLGVSQITITHLLNMSSGIEWIEEDRENLLQSDPWFALYSKASYKDMPLWVARHPVAHKPGIKFNYSSGDSALLTAVIRGALGEHRHASYPWEKLFTPLGMKSMSIERDSAGNLGLHAIAYSSPLDIAKVGLLYLENGLVNGQRLWPRDWLDFSNKMAPAQYNGTDPNDRNLQNNQAYGAQIWLNVKRPGDGERPYPELPANALLGLGTRGQILLILPDEKLIFVRTATDSELSIKARKKYRHDIFKLLYGSLSQGARS